MLVRFGEGAFDGLPCSKPGVVSAHSAEGPGMKLLRVEETAESPEHRRIVAACLVNAVYVLEGDRTQGRSGEDQLARPWWEFFGFELVSPLETNENERPLSSFIIGAVFRLASRTSPSAPAMVIAVRGTLDHHDWGVNAAMFMGRGHERDTCRIVMQQAESLLGVHGMETNLWLCGHSLGAAVATYVGEQMAMKGRFFTTFLFNLPYILNRRRFGQIIDDFRALGNLVGRLIADFIADYVKHVGFGFVGANPYAFRTILRVNEERDQLQEFDHLNKWDPRVYVNPKDYLANPYIEYFEKKKMLGSPGKLPERIASATLVINLDEPGDELPHFEEAYFNKQWFDNLGDTFRRFTEAYFNKQWLDNRGDAYRRFTEAHSIMQWWKSGLRVKAERYASSLTPKASFREQYRSRIRVNEGKVTLGRINRKTRDEFKNPKDEPSSHNLLAESATEQEKVVSILNGGESLSSSKLKTRVADAILLDSCSGDPFIFLSKYSMAWKSRDVVLASQLELRLPPLTEPMSFVHGIFLESAEVLNQLGGRDEERVLQLIGSWLRQPVLALSLDSHAHLKGGVLLMHTKMHTPRGKEKEEHQTIVAACLVKAAYVLERDRMEERIGEDRLARPWWEFFGFELNSTLINLESSLSSFSIGTVFRLKAASGTSPFAPAMVIAVRGTVNHHDWGVNVDTLLGRGRLRDSYRIVMEQAESLVRDHGMESNLWLCGHSLGAAVATFVGDQMAKKGIFFTTFLFNPPYILNRRSKDGFLQKIDDTMEVAGDVTGGLIAGKFGRVGANLAAVAQILLHKDKKKKRQLQQFDNIKGGDEAALEKNPRYKKKQDQLQQFDNLNKWDPRVYVNPKDLFCTWYIKYFKKKMKGSPNKLPKRMASATLVINLDEPGHELLHFKMAYFFMQCLVKPKDAYRCFKEAHSIMQWWKPGLRVEAKRYVLLTRADGSGYGLHGKELITNVREFTSASQGSPSLDIAARLGVFKDDIRLRDADDRLVWSDDGKDNFRAADIKKKCRTQGVKE
ncbi:hypothetical protein EJ110_NYTH06151 [Nymphaea thermarum]|nr:hypothetical protein EJ110_NYTH06151 [Nymphaea thermarum]